MADDDIRIRLMNEYDIPVVSAIENELFEYPWTEQELLINLKMDGTKSYVAIKDEMVVGYIYFSANQEVDSMCHDKNLLESNVIVHNIAVSGSYQRDGIGSRLLMEAEIFAKEHDYSLLAPIRSTNKNAQSFFSKNGCQFLAAQEHFYVDWGPKECRHVHEPRILMNKRTVGKPID